MQLSHIDNLRDRSPDCADDTPNLYPRMANANAMIAMIIMDVFVMNVPSLERFQLVEGFCVTARFAVYDARVVVVGDNALEDVVAKRYGSGEGVLG